VATVFVTGGSGFIGGHLIRRRDCLASASPAHGSAPTQAGLLGRLPGMHHQHFPGAQRARLQAHHHPRPGNGRAARGATCAAVRGVRRL